MNLVPSDSRDPALERWCERQGARLAAGHADTRLERERAEARRVRAVESGRWRRLLSTRLWVHRFLHASGTRGVGRRNALAIDRVDRGLAIAGLPDALVGLRVLQVSDPHFGADPSIDEAIVEAVAGIEHDLCVLTGDYRFRTFGPIDRAIEGVARLRERLDERVVAVLGNHDALAMVAPIEAMGVRVLLNECETLRVGGASLHLVGVDDPRYYRLDDLDRALAGRAETSGPSATLVLAHSPEIAEAAAAAGCGAYLCGHTHGGQICLPGRVPIMRNARSSAGRLSGAWRVDGMSGYTSRGAGVSIVPARFFCPPEITRHVLERADGGAREGAEGNDARSTTEDQIPSRSRRR